MKTQLNSPRPRLAFTLIELLVVMAVIATLAAMIFPAVGAIKKRAAIKRVESQLKAIESAIETYKANVKVFPPENPVPSVLPGVHPSPHLNSLYYELVGTELVTGEYRPTSGRGNITEAGLKTFLGLAPGLDFGLANVTRGGGDELQAANNSISNLKPNQYLEVTVNGVVGMVLGVTDVGPLMLSNSAGDKTINPWRYTSSRATNNVGSYDLWVDVIIAGKTNRISNWADKPTIVYY